MNNFEEWYKKTYPDFCPELDDMYEQLKEAYYSGHNKAIDDLIEDTTGPECKWMEVYIEDVLDRRIGQ
jgi:hypothetical protein